MYKRQDLLITQAPGDIGVLRDDGSVELLLNTEFSERYPSLSPSGRGLAYRSDETGSPSVYVQPFPNVNEGKWQISSAGSSFGSHPVWSPDEQQLFFVGGEFPGDLMVAAVATEPNFSPSTPSIVVEGFGTSFSWGTGNTRGFDITPDGSRFIARTRGGFQSDAMNIFTGLVVVENWFEELNERIPIP